MRSETRLDFAVFQLTPTRTRCELLVSAGGVREKLASGLLKPFLAHLKAAEEEIERGGYSIKLVPFFADSTDAKGAGWFTKGTIERFVRFVSTPEVLERVSSVEAELVQIEEAISIQACEARVDEQHLRTPSTPPQGGFVMQSFNSKKGLPGKSHRNSMDGADGTGGDCSKWRLLRAMDARRLMLQKEQGMAFARAAAAGFDREHMEDLIAFADCFGATRLREACVKFTALCKKRQEAGFWVEEMELAAAEAVAIRPEGLKHPGAEFGSFIRGKDYSDAWSDVHSEGGDEIGDDVILRSHNNQGFLGDDNPKSKRSVLDDVLVDGSGDYGPAGGPTGHRSRRYSQGSGMVPPSIDELQATAYTHDTFGICYGLSPGVYPVGRMAMDVAHQGENVGGQEYREGERNHGHCVRPNLANQAPRYFAGYHSISPSTSPVQRTSVGGWVQGGEDDLGYDSRGHCGSAYPAGRGSHGAVPYGLQNQYSNSGAPHHSSYTENLQWREPESYVNWSVAQLQSQYRQSNVGCSDNFEHEMRGQQSNPPHAQSYADLPRGPEVHYANASPVYRRVSQSQRGSQSPEGVVGSSVSLTTAASSDNQKSQGVLRDRFGECAAANGHPAVPHCGSGLQSLMVLTETNSSGIEQLNLQEQLPAETLTADRVTKSPMEKLSLSQMDASNRRLARRSTSPRRRSSSPLRKVQVGRSGARRSGLVVIRNINYISSSQEKNKSRVSNDDSDGNESGNEEGIQQQKTDNVRFSVKDAISLFEKKRRDSGDSTRKNLGMQCTGPSGYGGSSDNERGSPSFSDRVKRWTGASEQSSHHSVRQSKGSPVDDQDLLSRQEGSTLDQERSCLECKTEEQEVHSGLSHSVQQEVHQDAEGEVVEEQITCKLQPMEGLVSVLHTRGQIGCNVGRLVLKSQAKEIQNDNLHGDEMVLPLRVTQNDYKNSRSELQLNSMEQGVAHQVSNVVDDSLIPPEHSIDKKARGVVNQDSELNASGPVTEMPLKESLGDDSFIVPVRGLVQEKTLVRMMSTDIQEVGIRADQHITSDDKTAETSGSFATEVLLYIPERNSGRESQGRPWNISDCDTEFYADGVSGKYQEDDDQTLVSDCHASADQQGRFYEQYREKRDAKLREEPGSKRAEREAKLKAMQEVLERRKAEMASRSGKSAEKFTCSADAQQRAENLRAFKAALVKTKKEKDEEERKRIDELRTQRRERIAARASPTGTQSATCTPRALRQAASTPKSNSLLRLSPSKNPKTATTLAINRALISSSPKTSVGRLSSVGVPSSQQTLKSTSSQVTIENPLSRSVPSLMDLRKENTKPISGRSSLNDKVGGSARMQTKFVSTMHRSKSANDAGPLEFNGGVHSRSVARATISNDKKRRSLSSRRSISTESDVKFATGGIEMGPTKVSKDAAPELILRTVTKSLLSTVAQEAKPFLRKGSGIGPGTGPTVRKLKSSPVTCVPQNLEEGKADTFLCASQDCVESQAEQFKEQADVKSQESGNLIPLQVGIHLLMKDSKDIIWDAEERADGGHDVIAIQMPLLHNTEPGESLVTDVQLGSLQEVDEVSQLENNGSTSNLHAVEDGKDRNEDIVNEVLCSPLRTARLADFNLNEPVVSPLPPQLVGSHFTDFPLSTQNDYNPDLKHASLPPSPATLAPNIDKHESILPSAADTVVPQDLGVSIAAVTLSPVASPVSQTFPQLQHSLLPGANKVDGSTSGKKWGGSPKSSSANSQQIYKDAPKGLKRLLHFGRRSRASTTRTTEWVSASTASEGEDDTEEIKSGVPHSGEVISKKAGSNYRISRRKPTVNGKNNLRYMGDSPDASKRASNFEGATDQGSVCTLVTSIPVPPAYVRPQREDISGSTLSKAPRSSFFSLSSFRSRPDSKYRA